MTTCAWAAQGEDICYGIVGVHEITRIIPRHHRIDHFETIGNGSLKPPLRKWKWNPEQRSREKKKVPSKRWSEGRQEIKTHRDTKLLYDTKQHGNTGKRKRSRHGQNAITWRKRNNHDQCNDRLWSNRRFYRQKALR